MTSRKGVLERCSTDELGGLIRWALRERVVGAIPLPCVWERIKERAEQPTAWSLMGLRFARGYRAVIARLSRVDAFLSAQIASWTWPENGLVEWRRDYRFTRFLDQYVFLLQLTF
ncbi:MAG TPA: hypothetical protein EYP49_14760 [Anaerolineae bacterium]|nr:hypothetical protein [Anaerolineae bacterium]